MAVNESDKTILVAEVKRQASKIDLDLLDEKVRKIRQQHPDYEIELQGFSLSDLDI